LFGLTRVTHGASSVTARSAAAHVAAARLLRTGNAPKWAAADQATNTVYVTNGDDGTASVLNGATCNATVISGCH